MNSHLLLRECEFIIRAHTTDFKGQIREYSRDYTVVNCVQYFFQFLFFFNLRSYVFQSAKKCEMTSFSMTSLLVHVNEASKCVDIYHSHC